MSPWFGFINSSVPGNFTSIFLVAPINPNPFSVGFSNVVIKNMTILAPLNAPNTDGIDPGICYSLLLSLEST